MMEAIFDIGERPGSFIALDYEWYLMLENL